MVVIGIEGPSYAGKTTFTSTLHKKIEHSGFRCKIFPCYMKCIAYRDKLSIPLGIPNSIEEEIQALNLFLKTEYERFTSINQRRIDFVLLDRTFLTLLSHNYALNSLSSIDFYGATQKLIKSRISMITVPDVYVYINTPQKYLDKRYPSNDETIFTNPNYNALIREHFLLEKDKKQIIKNSIEISLANKEDLTQEVDKCFQILKTLIN